MLILLSPAKFRLQHPVPLQSILNLHCQRILSLAEVCKTFSPADLSGLMGISDKLAILNAERFNDFTMPLRMIMPAKSMRLMVMYTGLDAYSLSAEISRLHNPICDIVWSVWGIKTARFDAALSLRDGNIISD